MVAQIKPLEPLMLIRVTVSIHDRSRREFYDAVRGGWRVAVEKASQFRLVLGHYEGIVMGAYRPEGNWLPSTPENFYWLSEAVPGRFGFVGKPADPETWVHYVGKLVPPDVVKGQGSVRYLLPRLM